MFDNQQLSERIYDLTVNRHYGKYRGLVSDNQDPFYRGRLEVTVPGLLRSEKLWAMPCVPFAGKDMGVYMIPEIDTGVWIEFEGGDISYPLWTGCFWADDESPKDQSSTEPTQKMIRSSKGLNLVLDDEQETITISDKEGNNILTIESTAGKISIKANATIVLDAQSVLLGGESAFQPVVKGTELMTYLTSVVAAAAASLITLPPPTPNILSTAVKTM